ncbi:MAG: HD domain-containing protein [Lachnospiraceae bacterium]
MERLKKQMDFILEIDKEKNIRRQTLISDASRQETDAEHAWHLAVMCALLSEYSNEKIDVAHTMLMVLMHDLVEIDAGDTYAYDEEGNKSKAERELKAADRIYNLLPLDQAKMARELWDEFEAMDTPEARFANTLDKIQPVFLNDAAGGISWTRHGVYIDQILKRDARVHEGSEELWKYTKKILDKNVENGNIKVRNEE